LNSTVLFSCFAPKCAPIMVTAVPAAADILDIRAILGGVESPSRARDYQRAIACQ
jgi:hypothetical protein